jgi:hypothetical protein
VLNLSSLIIISHVGLGSLLLFDWSIAYCSAVEGMRANYTPIIA